MPSDSMFDGFDEVVADVRELEDGLARPESFYARMRSEYADQAIHIAREVLSALRPPETPQAEWDRKVRRVLPRITAELLTDGTGIVFQFAPASETSDGSVSPKDTRPDNQIMMFDDIKRWIEAGQRGEPGGKRLDKIDEKIMREKGVNGVASIVMKAYYSLKPDARYTRLRSAIQRYFIGVRNDESLPLLDAVSAAWESHFSVVIPRDLDEHVQSLCDAFGRKSGAIAR